MHKTLRSRGPTKPRHVDIVDAWNDTVVGTFENTHEALAALLKMQQETRRAQDARGNSATRWQ